MDNSRIAPSCKHSKSALLCDYLLIYSREHVLQMYRGETRFSKEVYVSPAGLVVSLKQRKRENVCLIDANDPIVNRKKVGGNFKNIWFETPFPLFGQQHCEI